MHNYTLTNNSLKLRFIGKYSSVTKFTITDLNQVFVLSKDLGNNFYLVIQEYPEVVNFRKADNTFQTMTLQDMKTLYLQYLLKKQQAWSIFKNDVAQITGQ